MSTASRASAESSHPRFDRGVVLVVLTRLTLLIAAPITLWLIATRRPVNEQASYFVFWNVQALTQLMELGVGAIIVQFASHESVSLTWTRDGELAGPRDNRVRMLKLIQEGCRWYRSIAWFVAIAVGLGGISLFKARLSELESFSWVAWGATVGFTAAYLRLIPILCVIEGAGRLHAVQRMRLVQAIAGTIALLAVLSRYGALWAVAVFAAVWLAVAWTWLRVSHSRLLLPMTRIKSDGPLLTREVRWRTFAMWIVAWAVPQTLTPMILALHGPTEAGRVGMSLAIATAPFSLATAWLQGRYYRYGALIARNMGITLRSLATAATIQAVLVCSVGTIAAASVLVAIAIVAPNVATRALQPSAILLLGVANIGWLIVQSLASYLRAWREEPMTEALVAGGAVVIVGSLIASLQMSAFGTVVAHVALVTLVALPIALLRFTRYRIARSRT